MLKEKLYSLVKNKKLFAAVIVGIVLLIAIILALVMHFTQTPKQSTDITTKAPDIQVSPTPTPVLTPTVTEAPTPAATSTPVPTPETTVPPTEKPTPAPTAKPTPKPTAQPTKEPTATMQIIYTRVLHLTTPPSAQPGETISMPAYPNMEGTYTIIISCPGCEEISETYSLPIANDLSIQWTVPPEAQPGTATIRTVADTSEEVYHVTITEITE